jgi:hypothetical protein
MRYLQAGLRITITLSVAAIAACGRGPTSPTVPPEAGTHWTLTKAPSGTTKWHGVVFGNGVWVAVGAGHRAVSANGSSWASSVVPAAHDSQTAVGFANGMFVASSTRGVSTSVDGVTWINQSLASDTTPSAADAQRIIGVTYGSGTWVMADDRVRTQDALGVFVSTTNGAQWESRLTTIPYSYPKDIGYGSGVFIVVGYRGLVATSTDLVNWTKQSLGDTTDVNLEGVTSANGSFVVTSASGKVYRSVDAGVTWIKTALSIGSLCAVGYGNGLFVVMGAGIFTSPDGITWTNHNWSGQTGFESVAYANKRFVAIGVNSFAISQ